MGVHDFVQVLIRHRLVIIVATILGLALGVGVSLLTATDQREPQVTSTASVRAVLLSEVGLEELEQRLAELTDGVVVAAATGRPPTRSALYAELMESQPIIAQVARDLGVNPDDLRASLSVSTEGGGLITIRSRGANLEQAQQALVTLVQVTNDRLTISDGPTFTVRLIGDPVVTRNPRPPLAGSDLDTAKVRITQELLADNATLYTASALTLSDRLTQEAIEKIDAALGTSDTEPGIVERLTWGGAADPSATVDPAAGTEITLDVVAPDDGAAIRAAQTTLDALDNVITPPDADVSPLIRLGVSATTTAIEQPRQDRTLTNAILGLLIGLAAGIGYAFLRESRDPRIRSGRQLAAFMSVPPIGLIAEPPRVSDLQTLRSNLLFGHSEVRTVAVTSPSQGDGKCEVARGLATTLTQTDRTVVLVDTDMYPKAAEVADPAAPVGLAEVLEGRAELAQALQPTADDGVSSLPAGTPLTDASDLLSRPRFTEVLEQLGKQFDYVLCVTAPLTDGSDAAIVSHCTNAALVLVRAGSTTTTALDNAANRLMQVDAKVLGIVVTGVAEADLSQWNVQYFQATSA